MSFSENLLRLLSRKSLLALWCVASFGVVFFAHDIEQIFSGWPWHFYYAAFGVVVVFIGICGGFAWSQNREQAALQPVLSSDQRSSRQEFALHKKFALYVVLLALFVLIVVLAEQMGLPKAWVGAVFLLATILLYAGIGLYCRTSDPHQFYLAGQQIPAMYNGMATAADWMSAASFISLAGGLYLHGFSGTATQTGGLVYILGWTGGFCLIALLVAPQLRALQVRTIPDFFAQRFGGRWPRMIAALAAIVCSFTYVVAQIYGVGLITSRLTGVQFEIGIMLGLGGVLVCSFLGGMRAVTWTQVAQYVVMLLAFALPVSWLAFKQFGYPLPWAAYGQPLQQIQRLEERLSRDVAEQSVQEVYRARAEKDAQRLSDVQGALVAERQQAQVNVQKLYQERASVGAIFSANRQLAAVPTSEAAARRQWQQSLQENQARAQPLAGMPRHTQAFQGDPSGSPQEQAVFDLSRRNFLALMFCLMVGTVGLPHVLTRFLATPSVAQTRQSAVWTLLFIALIYLAAPALAVMVKYEVMQHLVGTSFNALPNWLVQWAKVDKGLISVQDVNMDGVLQFAELKMSADVIMLATPELAGLPYALSALVAAGGLAAALSTADGLLLTIGNAFAHDLYRYGQKGRLREIQRVMMSKFALLLVALAAAYVATQKPADILYMVGASFSLAASAFVPALVLGLSWPNTNGRAVVAGMLVGLGVSVYYMLSNAMVVHERFGLTEAQTLWWGIRPIASGVFGFTAGLITIVIGSCVALAKRSAINSRK